MPSIKDLRKRITSTKNTQQTTKAMKMVSAAKLRRAQEAIQNQRPYARRLNELLRHVSKMSAEPIESPLIWMGDRTTPRKVLLVLVTSDRGLCGGFNANIIKTAQRWLKANEDECESIQLGFVGRRGHDFFKGKDVNVGPHYPEAGGKVVFSKAKKLADSLVDRFLSGEVNEVWFVYNEFKNAISQKVLVERFLPVDSDEMGSVEKKSEEVPLAQNSALIKPGYEIVLNQLLSKNFGVQAFRILLESQAGEHGARMSAMENATKNAGEMIRKLTLLYNKQRQAGITKELLEIIAGSESQKG